MANEWNVSYPIDHTLISDVPGEIRKLKTSAKAQLDMEHETPVDGDATGSEHSSGSAVAYEGTSTPSNRPDGATALADNAIDRGRVWLDDNYDPPQLKRWDGSSFERLDARLGSWASKSNNTVYQAASDGFVLAFNTTGGAVFGYTDGSNPPTTERVCNDANVTAHVGITMPVRKGDYWKVAGASTVYWLPIGA